MRKILKIENIDYFENEVVLLIDRKLIEGNDVHRYK